MYSFLHMNGKTDFEHICRYILYCAPSQVCNAKLRILVVDPRFPGSCHDSWVWQHNLLRASLAAQLQPGKYLLGDSGYPLEPWLLVPLPGSHAGTTSEGHYNREHASMRNVVERCIGVLKSKFRCLQRFKTLLYSPDRAARIIYACVALHNIALDAGDWTLDDYGGEVPPAEEPEQPGDIQVLAPHDVFPQRKAAAQRRCPAFLKDTGMVRSDVLRCGAHLLQDLA
nr:putative nuclease HARBI1 [Dermacentor andersoni]